VTTSPDTLPTRVFLSVNELCAAYDISRAHLYRLIQAGRGPRLTKIGDATRIHVDDASAWSDQLRSAPAELTRRGRAKPVRRAAPTESAAEIGARAARDAIKAVAGSSNSGKRTSTAADVLAGRM
jgi:predicted DNA-binding transcriptional regulator AlpA